MKNYLKIAVVSFLIFALPHFSSAQTPAPAKAVTPIAHLNLDSLLKISPRFKAATDSANAYMATLENQLYSMQAEYQRKLNEYDSLNKTWSPLIKGLKEKEISDLENNIQAFQQQAQDDFTTYRAAKYAPIFDDIDKAVKAVAIAHGYKYVLDSTKGGGVMYCADSDDIFNEVRIKLGIPLPPAPKPGGTPAPGGSPAPGH